MAKAGGGGGGGAATLSSFRVQKAFSINFRENKRLFAEIRLIEGEHIRNVRQVKQDIKETRIWLDNIRESTGYSQHGVRPDSVQEQRRRSRRKKGVARSKTVEPVVNKAPEIVIHSDSSDDESISTKHTGTDTHVRFAWNDPDNTQEATVRPWTEAKQTSSVHNAKDLKNAENARKTLKSEPAPTQTRQNDGVRPNKAADDATQRDEDVEKHFEEDENDKRRQRVHSAASGRSSHASLTTYQRRRKLQSMMVKKRNPLDIKKEMNARECARVSGKVQNYLAGIDERMKISMPDMSLWELDLTRHDTPFAQDVNVTL